MPRKVVNTLNKEIHSMLPKSESIDLNVLGLSEETMYILYRNITMYSDMVSIGFDMTFDNDSFSDLEGDPVAFFVQNFEVAASNLTELAIFAVFGIMACLCGCAFRYWMWRRRDLDDKFEISPNSPFDGTSVEISDDE